MMTTASFIVVSFYLLVWLFSKHLATHIPVSQPPEVIAALGTPVKLLCFFNCSCPGRAYGSFNSSNRKVFGNVTCTTVDQERVCESKSVIVNTTLDDENIFICKVKIPGENISFEGEGSGTKLILYAEPSSVEIKEVNPVVEGRSANLTCTVRGMYPQNIILSWFRNDLFSALPSELTSTRILTSSGEIQSVLSFTPNINDHGTSYWCQASHPLWRRNVTQHKLLDVKSGPRALNVTILKGLETLNDLSEFLVIPKHTYIELSCSADGNPKPLIMWIHEKEDYKNSTDSSLVIHKHILVIKKMTKESEGLYTCVANNSYGMINVTVSISATEGTGIILIYFTIIAICNVLLMMACLGFCLLVKQKGNKTKSPKESRTATESEEADIYAVPQKKRTRTSDSVAESVSYVDQPQLTYADITFKREPRNSNLTNKENLIYQELQSTEDSILYRYTEPDEPVSTIYSVARMPSQ